ncbi:MAG: lysophospholipid acyltransferase family protein [Endomicrobium sp.]|jgi:KDO2-lipid IV(A) lauroyltransferase|nr:lysophospholipid acyltransferase family protein [Endomicrobium sp.]
MKRTRFQNCIEYLILKIFIVIFFLLGKNISQFLGRIIATVMYYFIPVRKREVLENISLSFTEKTKKDIKLIAKNTYKTFIKMVIDVIFLSKISDADIKKLLIYDENIIKKALDKGNGLILMSAHFGNWELSAFALSKKYPLAFIVAKQSNSLVNKLLSDFRRKKGFNITNFQRDLKMSFRSAIKILKKNQILAILGDQDAGEHGVFLPFLGRLASTPRGPAFFAIHAGSPIVTAFSINQSDGSIKIELEDITMPNTGNKQKDIEIINSIYNKRLEKVIRSNPEQWFWFHRRWKSIGLRLDNDRKVY